MRRNPHVRIAGHRDAGPPSDATIRLLDRAEAKVAYGVLKRRYRLLFLQRLLFGRHPGRHVTCGIRPRTGAEPPD